ncbi:phospholipase D-like domain-containing protein [Roseimaritima sediminicola]|uniref:hypothetical protein n=1 Tax=Roseimaritima sediminicola TaxID=2662066 RepID=UPI0012983E3F|nr:hypothetical protein [Roseimaritima sediminicola]
MTFFSEALIDDEYVRALRADIELADICRFLVAYISDNGLNRIGRLGLLRMLHHENSFGVGSMSCSCGFEPLLQLQGELPSDCLRLKYFMDPAVRGTDEPDQLVLMHSKLIYLRTNSNGEQKSVVYLGSHNWSARALGGSGPRSAEASYRFEFPFKEEHLAGTGSDTASKVNKHLLRAFHHPCCLPATNDNHQTFEEWTQSVCKPRPQSILDEVLLILAVRSDSENMRLPLSSLQGGGVYLQSLEEEEGSAVWDSPDQTLVLVWETPSALANGDQPTILLCNRNTRNAGPTSDRRGTNQANNPIAGFKAVLFDRNQIERQESGRIPARSLLSGRKEASVQVFDMEYPAASSDCQHYDRSVTPKYQFLLEVAAVIDPETNPSPNSQYVWDRSTFAVAHKREDARFEIVNGYVVPDEQYDEIITALQRDFGVSPVRTRAKALPNPMSRVKRLKLGKRFAASPIHDTFIPEQIENAPDDLYAKTSDSLLAPDLDPPENEEADEPMLFKASAVIERSQRVFTTKIEKLKEVWQAAARANSQTGSKPE